MYLSTSRRALRKGLEILFGMALLLFVLFDIRWHFGWPLVIGSVFVMLVIISLLRKWPSL